MTTISPVHHAAGANIKGTPAMPARKVRADLKVLRKRADVLMLQEFRWPWYWRVAMLLLGIGKRWASSPVFKAGKDAPVRGAQGILWKRKAWKRVKTRVWLLHDGVAKVSESRFVRAVLLQDRVTGQFCWFLSTHFVVGGDESSDSPLRRGMLNDNIGMVDQVLSAIARSGHPVVFELDANIRSTSDSYDEWMAMLKRQDMKVHGAHGVEYMLTRSGVSTKINVHRNWVVPTTMLNTDHETRGITYTLVG